MVLGLLGLVIRRDRLWNALALGICHLGVLLMLVAFGVFHQIPFDSTPLVFLMLGGVQIAWFLRFTPDDDRSRQDENTPSPTQTKRNRQPEVIDVQVPHLPATSVPATPTLTESPPVPEAPFTIVPSETDEGET